MESYFSIDGLRVALVIVGALAQAIMAYWPDVRNWPHTIGTRSENLQNPVVPIDWAFAIWLVIFASCGAFAVWHALPQNLTDPLSQQVGWLSVALFFGNVLWEVYVPKRALDWVSVVIIGIELALVLTILFILARSPAPDALDYWLVHVPFQIFAGWVSAATFVNLASTLQYHGVEVRHGVAVGLIVTAAILGALVAWATGAWFYALTIVWALFGIAFANIFRDRRLGFAALATVAIGGVLAAAAL